MSRTTAPLGLAAVAMAAAVLTGCGSSTGGDPASATRVATADAQDPESTLTAVPTTAAPSVAPSDEPSAVAGPQTGSSAAPSVAVSTAPPGSGEAAGIPAVSNATDLTKQPVAAAGSGSGPTGLVVRDLVAGSGTPAKYGDTVSVKYAGTLYATGASFDASWTDGAPMQLAAFPLIDASTGGQGVIGGFAYGIAGMQPGGRREIVIPAALGYGAAGRPPAIPANAPLVFIVDYKGPGTTS